ncbi:MAG: ABC transporter permease [Clostridiales bacterium]
MFRESIKMSWNNIINNKMRSFLTVLGIVIGVSSIIALITIVQGATNSITSEISKLGADKITIQAMGTPLKSGLNESDLEQISKVEYIKGASPTVSGNSSIVYNDTVIENIAVQGKNEVYFKTESENLGSGRGINIVDVENETPVAVVGSEIAKEFFLGENPIGKEILIKNRTYTIIGLLKPTSGFAMGSTNDVVMIPYTSAMKSLGIGSITSVDAYMDNPEESDTIMESLNGVLSESFNYREDAFSVFNMQDMLDTVSNITGMMSLLLAGIASISLLVGGIGIMNMMLVSVTERTSEIGLRKALGAEPGSIQMQFLIESIVLCLFGGAIGFLLGVGIAFIASIAIGFELSLTYTTVLIAIGFSAFIGVVFGLTPARKASKLNPIDALRHT